MRHENRLKDIRRQRGLAISGLATLASASSAMISAIERWGYFPQLETRKRIAQALTVDVDHIWPEESRGEHGLGCSERRCDARSAIGPRE